PPLVWRRAPDVVARQSARRAPPFVERELLRRLGHRRLSVAQTHPNRHVVGRYQPSLGGGDSGFVEPFLRLFFFLRAVPPEREVGRSNRPGRVGLVGLTNVSGDRRGAFSVPLCRDLA